MLTALTVLHLLVSILLVVVILMQSKQSMNLSGMFGGASQSAIGSQPQSVLSTATWVLGILFALISLVYALVPPEDEGALSPGAVESPPAQQQQQPPPASQSSPSEQSPGSESPGRPSEPAPTNP